MTKTGELVKFDGTTTFFPKIIVTKEEMKRLWEARQIPASWLKTVVENYDDFPDITAPRHGGLTKAQAYKNLVNGWSYMPETIVEDVEAFSKGNLDIIDLVVKYGVGAKQCRKFVKDVLYEAGVEMDVDAYWKQHKKHAQKNTTVALYGVTHTAMREEVQEKRRATNRERYGADNPMGNPEIKEKLRKRILAEHGVEYTFLKRTQVPAWQKRLFDCLMKDPIWESIFKDLCKKAGEPFTPELFGSVFVLYRRDFIISELENTHVEDLLRLWKTRTGQTIKYPSNMLFRLPITFSKSWLRHYEKLGLVEVPELFYSGLSVYEKHMEYFLNDLGVSYLRNHKKALNGLEMDFFIPDKMIGIEINPNISHNSNLYATEPIRSMFSSHKEPSYHYNKYKLAAKAGITLIQLFANDIDPVVFDQITGKRLKSMLCGYDEVHYGRNVTVRPVLNENEKKTARAFLEEHHSQGSSRASEYWLFKEREQILGTASFSKMRNKEAMELKRLCFAPGIQVVGGLSKLIAHYFREHQDCQTIYSYSDNSLGNGNAYERAGGQFVKETGPALKFISPHNGQDAYSWQIATSWGAEGGVIGQDAAHKGLSKPTVQNEIDEYIERELSHRLDDLKGYDRIYTPGSKLWKFTRKE